MDKLTVSRIHISNFLGIEELEVAPGALTVAEGANGAGKTSLLEAIRAVVGGGDATVIRQGADEAEVVLVLSDETEYRRRITPTGTELTARHPIQGKVRAPGARLAGLLDALAFNPIHWLTSKPADQVEALLDSLPMTVTADQVAEAVGPDAASVVAGIATEGHALRVLDVVHSAIYSERTQVNRVAREKRSTAVQLHSSLPPVGTTGEEAATRLAALRAERDGLLDQRSTDIAAVVQEREADLAELRRTAQAQIDKIKADAQAAADQIKEEAATRIDELNAAVGPRSEVLAGEIATLEAHAAEAVRTKTTRELAERTAAEADEHERRSEALTQALARVEALKTATVGALPIPGLEIRDGTLFHEGVPFARVNQAQRVRVALMLAQLRAKRHGGLPLVCVDGLECLDAETFAAFRKSAPEAGLQLVVARVGEGPLSVTEIPAAEVA